MSQDPISREDPGQFLGDPQQMNSYAYSKNNPVKYLDPNGKVAVLFSGFGNDTSDMYAIRDTSVPVQSASGETKLLFRIEGEIDQKAVRSRPRTIRSEDGRWKEQLAATAVVARCRIVAENEEGSGRCHAGAAMSAPFCL
jgi:hypothetical protein